MRRFFFMPMDVPHSSWFDFEDGAELSLYESSRQKNGALRRRFHSSQFDGGISREPNGS